MIYWKRLLLGATEKKGGLQGWTVREKKCVGVKEVGVQLVMDLTESCLWCRQKLG